ncbi:hypothetical protein [Rhodococcus sp. IEGM 1318]|nr:hypothetical protein [Rhodococcus sp. IEGM 1318]MDV8009032.1 hypothetical protein [Rhodococcus sp. IEGM 1318]
MKRLGIAIGAGALALGITFGASGAASAAPVLVPVQQSSIAGPMQKGSAASCAKLYARVAGKCKWVPLPPARAACYAAAAATYAACLAG